MRSTKPVTFTPSDFVAPRGIRIPREQSHLTKHPDYPDTLFYLSHSGKYFFRHADLRHLRIEQVNRYFAFGDGDHASENLEDTLGDEDDEVDPRLNHRHYDKFAQDMPPGTLMHSTAQGVPGLRRRKPGRLAVSRVPLLEPIGARHGRVQTGFVNKGNCSRLFSSRNVFATLKQHNHFHRHPRRVSNIVHC